MVQGMGLWPLACWNCGLEYSWGHGCLSLVSVVCCKVEVSVLGRSLAREGLGPVGLSSHGEKY